MDVVSLASEFPNDNPALHRGVIWVNPEPTGGARPERAAPATREPSFEAAPIDARAHDSLAPPEDDEIDESAAPIVVEELEPIEASLEGQSIEDAEPVVVAEASEAPAPAESGVVLVTAEAAPPPPAQSEVVLAGVRVEATDREEAWAPLTPVLEEVVASEVPRETTSTSLPPAPDDPFTVLVCTLADVAISAGSPHVASLLPGLLFDGRLSDPLDAEVAEALRREGLWDGHQVAPAFVAVTAAWRAILRGTSDDFDACGAAMLDEWAADLLARLLAAPARAPMLRQELRSRGVAAFGLAA